MAESFLQTLREVSVVDKTSVALDILDEFCQAIRDYTEQKLECGVKQGFLVNMGQEWRVIIKPAGRDFEQILLRAYIPLGGFPTELDLYDDALVRCGSEDELRANLASFLQRKTIVETILFLKKQASALPN